MAESKRVLILSDLHCGHNLGLTHPDYFNHFKEIQQVGWDFYSKNIKKLGKIDLCIVNGDAIEGRGAKESMQHNTTNISEQQQIAISCLEKANAKKYVFLRGTPYHVSNDFECEDAIADHFGAEIFDSRKIEVNGCLLHCRHTTGKSGTAYASITSLQRSAVVQILNDVESGGVKADIYIRSHAHEYDLVDRELFTAFITPGLQFKGTNFGRKCTGFYSYGFMWMDIRSKKDFDIHKEILPLTGGDYKVEEITKI